MDPRSRQIFGNRTLNLRSIRAIGYDMDYTLIHYDVEAWERVAFEHTRNLLLARDWPVADLEFDPRSVIRGLTIDSQLGNLVKPTRFGYVIRGSHGLRHLEYEELRDAYESTFVDLADDRWVFLNTLFSLSEASLYAQLVELLDADALPGRMTYRDLYGEVRDSLSEAHLPGMLKEEILADPERFVHPDPEIVLTLQDQAAAGKRLVLITNSEWEYASRIMEYAFDPYLAGGTWRDLFEAVVVSADKPAFFQTARPLYRIDDEEAGTMRPHVGPLTPGDVFVGGSAPLIEEYLELEGGQILYVGDHLFADVSVSKAVLRWRTALILRELESEVEAIEAFAGQESELQELMGRKVDCERALAAARLDRLRERSGHAAPPGDANTAQARIDELQAKIAELDEQIGPYAQAAGRLRNEAWGPLMRSGLDKSLFARQVERYADVYTSRVSNFLAATPYAFLRAARGSLPHDD